MSTNFNLENFFSYFIVNIDKKNYIISIKLLELHVKIYYIGSFNK